MRISTRGRYGARVMLELALKNGQGPVPLRKLAQSQEISAKYLEQIINPLMVAGMVRSVRGARGGYYLNRDPGAINLYEIVSSLEGPLSPVECVEDPNFCDRVGGCSVHLVWNEMEERIKDFLTNLTLEILLQRQKEKDLICPPDRNRLAQEGAA